MLATNPVKSPVIPPPIPITRSVLLKFLDNNFSKKFIKSIENRMGYKIGCIEEIALNNKWITKNELKKTGIFSCSSEYGLYVKSLTK